MFQIQAIDYSQFCVVFQFISKKEDKVWVEFQVHYNYRVILLLEDPNYCL